MKSYSTNRYGVKPKPNYRVTFLLASVFHLVLFSALFVTLRFSKPLFLTASTPLAVIHATAVESAALPSPRPPPVLEKENSATHAKQLKTKPTLTKAALEKPLVVEKSPLSLPIKEKTAASKLTTPTPIPPVRPSPKTIKTPPKNSAQTTSTHAEKKPLAKLVAAKPIKPVKKTNPKAPALSAKSLQLAQKNVQQLLQQEVNSALQKTQQKNQRLARNAATTTKYRHLILQSIAQQWIIPPDVDKRLETRLSVRLAPGGMVLDVTIIKGSGNPVLDRSAQTAVYKASPLPVPKESGLFNDFRQINLTVRPEGLIS